MIGKEPHQRKPAKGPVSNGHPSFSLRCPILPYNSYGLIYINIYQQQAYSHNNYKHQFTHIFLFSTLCLVRLPPIYYCTLTHKLAILFHSAIDSLNSVLRNESTTLLTYFHLLLSIILFELSTRHFG